MSLYGFLALSNHPVARFARRGRRALTHFSIPAPRVVVRSMLGVYLLLREGHYFLARVFVCEPLFKAYCTRYGQRLTTGVFVHWIQGKGDILLGNDVSFDGKISITFAMRFADRPALVVGDRTGISHACSFTIGKRITIGSDCRIAGDVHMFDSSGHPSDAVKRAAGAPPETDDVKPIVIHDHVWIGRRVLIFPGVTIGQGSIISAGSVVLADVAPYTVVAGNPARKIATLSSPQPPIPTPT